MAKETTKNTPVANACEQYVLEELKQAKQDLERLRKQLDTADKAYKNLVNIVVKGTMGLRIVKDESIDYDYLYFQDDFITTLFKDHNKESEIVRAFITLINTGKLLPLI